MDVLFALSDSYFIESFLLCLLYTFGNRKQELIFAPILRSIPHLLGFWSGRIRGLQDWWNSLKVLHLTKYVLQARISSRDVPIEMIS